jgi:hypothetical protein
MDLVPYNTVLQFLPQGHTAIHGLAIEPAIYAQDNLIGGGAYSGGEDREPNQTSNL